MLYPFHPTTSNSRSSNETRDQLFNRLYTSKLRNPKGIDEFLEQVDLSENRSESSRLENNFKSEHLDSNEERGMERVVEKYLKNREDILSSNKFRKTTKVNYGNALQDLVKAED